MRFQLGTFVFRITGGYSGYSVYFKPFDDNFGAISKTKKEHHLFHASMEEKMLINVEFID